MFPLDLNRKRNRQSLEGTSTASNAADEILKGPLQGVVACLTGFSPQEKESLHLLINKLGGIYTRDMNSTRNTHLIACKPQGDKYETAVACKNIQIVKGSWLEACDKQQVRVAEDGHHFVLEKPQNTVMSLEQALDQQLRDQKQRSSVFSACNFHLVGFKEDSDLHLKIGRLIRAGLGTIYWEFNDAISYVIVNDGTDESIRQASHAISLEHPNCPVFVSPWWVISTWEAQALQKPSEFPPEYQATKRKELIEPKAAPDDKASVKSSSLFRGCVFALLRMAPPPEAVDFDSKELEKSIRAHEGQILSSKLVEALKVDLANSQDEKRTCYVIWWGGHTPSHVSFHPLLAEVKRHNLCDMVHATPVWLQTCISDQKCVSVRRYPLLFAPSSWPIHALNHSVAKAVKEKPIRISVTGFSGSKRTAIVHLIQAMGAVYDDSMRTSTTHLICREASGQKYEKAVEWKLYVISVDWLYHVARFGYCGENGKDGFGCEDRFSIAASNEMQG